MSLIARCPACATLFRVVPDQLKISDGWVRCGQCSEVFDATLTLQPALQATGAAVADVPDPAATGSVRVESSEPEPPAEAPVAEEFPDRADPVLEPGPLTGEPVQAREEPAAASPLQDLAFVRQARRRAFWRRRGVRVILGMIAGGLGLLLAGQVVFQHSDRLASQWQVMRPALTALCATLPCRLGPPQRIEAIAIESSAFTRVRADAFRLSVTLSNQAEIAVAMPALELTLTDLQDQPVLRRVLQPSDLAPETPPAIAARADWSSTLTLVIAPDANPARIVGYRVLAFYP